MSFFEIDIIQKFFCDLCNRNIVNIQFITFNKKQKQVERAFKLGKLYLPGCSIHEIFLKNKLCKCSRNVNREMNTAKESFTQFVALQISSNVGVTGVIIFH